MVYFDTLQVPFGKALLVSNEAGALTHLYTRGADAWLANHLDAKRDPERLATAMEQIREYLDGRRKEFDLALEPAGSPFQRLVWAALCKIPFGETRSYGQLASEIGHDGAARAVGRANATNPIAIVVPCHRVIGANGALTGYAGGIGTKDWLLRHEGVCPPAEQTHFEFT